MTGNYIVRAVKVGAICLLLTGCGSRKQIPLPETGIETGLGTREAAVKDGESESLNESLAQETEASSVETVTLERIKKQLGWENGQLGRLEEIQALLDKNAVPYIGYYNESEERLDMELEDGASLMFLQVGGGDTSDASDSPHMELFMIDGRLNRNGFQESYLHQYDVTADEEFYPDTKGQLIGGQDLWMLNQTDLSIARNQIYARHGRKFTDPFLSAVFQTKNWYHPIYTAEEFGKSGDPFSETEKKNLKTILEHENSRWNHEKPDGTKIQPAKKLLSGSWIDLDGDQVLERVYYETQIDSYGAGAYTLEVGKETAGGKKSAAGEGEGLYRYLGLISLDGETNLLLAGGSGASDDQWYDYYLYGNDELHLAGTLPGGVIGYEGVTLYTRTQTDHFQSFITTFAYVLDQQENILKSVPEILYPYGNTAVVKQDITLYADQTGSAAGVTLKTGDRVVIVGSDLQYWVKIEKEVTGESGWIRCDLPFTCIMPDGREMQSDDLFDGLPFFG